MERPWYTTGANELLGVVVAQDTSPTAGLPNGVDPDQISVLGFDPISVSSHDPNSSYTQAQFGLLPNTQVPLAYGPNGNFGKVFQQGSGNPVSVPSPAEPTATLYNIWGIQPEFDQESDLWYADIRLGDGNNESVLPPGYFSVRLSLVRFQPYAITGEVLDNLHPTYVTSYPYAKFLSTNTLVTFAQPVSDRSVSVVRNSDGTFNVTVSGPGYYGWRPISSDPSKSSTVQDSDNKYALHPNTGNGSGGTKATSTMVVEVQQYDESAGYGG